MQSWSFLHQAISPLLLILAFGKFLGQGQEAADSWTSHTRMTSIPRTMEVLPSETRAPLVCFAPTAPLSSRLPQGWPFKLCLHNSIAFLVQNYKVFHIPQTNLGRHHTKSHSPVSTSVSFFSCCVKTPWPKVTYGKALSLVLQFQECNPSREEGMAANSRQQQDQDAGSSHLQM